MQYFTSNITDYPDWPAYCQHLENPVDGYDCDFISYLNITQRVNIEDFKTISQGEIDEFIKGYADRILVNDYWH